MGGVNQQKTIFKISNFAFTKDGNLVTSKFFDTDILHNINFKKTELFKSLHAPFKIKDGFNYTLENHDQSDEEKLENITIITDIEKC